MSQRDLLAARLRQAVQGCTVHLHGPIQAWAAIEQACVEGAVQRDEVAMLAIEACTNRIKDLRQAGVDASDVRIKKEELTRTFIEKLLL
ncbi:MAG: hypothetical protein IPK68_02110 [Bdellovibrionales bacterium]|nr:hypothetical protein [Bdellovibrionales bacterium]